MSQRLSKPFWPPALASQAPPAIILAVLRRFRGSALLRGLCPSSSQGAPFWPSGLTLRSSGLAFSQPLTLAVSPFIFRFMQASIYSSGSPISKVSPLGFCRVPGFALGCCASFKRFWPLALVQQALPAIILQALRRLRGAVLFRSLRPSSSWGFPCWLLGLTVQSSRPAFGGRLTFVR